MSSISATPVTAAGTATAIVYGHPYHLGLSANVNAALSVGQVGAVWFVRSFGRVERVLAGKRLCIGHNKGAYKLMGAQPWMRAHQLIHGHKLLVVFRWLGEGPPEVCLFHLRDIKALGDAEKKVLRSFLRGKRMVTGRWRALSQMVHATLPPVSETSVDIAEIVVDHGAAQLFHDELMTDVALSGLVGLAPLRSFMMRCLRLGRALPIHRAATGVDHIFTFHAAFVGPPGTGKTECAQRIARLLFEAGLTKRKEAVVVGARQLVGQYLGKTDPLVRATVASALGGVLFIDEAYMLTASMESRDYGREAVATLIELMEKHRGELVVIFAGYETDIKRLLASNPGLRSRVPRENIVKFPELNVVEAYEALKLMAAKNEVEVHPLCRHIWCDLALLHQMPTTGRELRNLFDALVSGPSATRTGVDLRALRIEPADFAVVSLRRRHPTRELSAKMMAMPADDELN
jgi:hypothetical protein